MPGINFQALRSEVTISQVLDLVGFVPGRRRGEQLRGPCPIHRSQTPDSRTFSVNVKRNTYRCFKCRSAGNQLDLWAAATNQELYSATLELCKKLNLVVPWVYRW